MFLMAIGVSTMAAGASNAGALMRQNEYNRVLLLSKSVHDNMMFSLQAKSDDPASYRTLLGYQLALAVFNEYKPDIIFRDITDIIISIDGDPIFDSSVDPADTITNLIRIGDITIKFPFIDIVDSPAVYFDRGDDLEQERIKPRTATMNARMIVELDVTARDRKITSRATYEYTNGRLSDEPLIGDDVGAPDYEYIMRFEPDGFGEWNLVSYEVIDIFN